MLRDRKNNVPAKRRFIRFAALLLVFAAGWAASGIRSTTEPTASAVEPADEGQPVPPQREQPPREDQKADLAPVENDATHVVTALIQASRQRSTLMGDDQQPNEERDWQIFCSTQRALLQSFSVLNSAFQEPGLAELPVLADQDEPIQWLLQRLDFDFEPNSEILSIGMTCRESEVPQFVKIIDAIAKSYVDYAVNEQRKRRLASRDSFAGALAKLNDQIYRKTEDYLESAKQIGSSDGGQENSEAKRIMADVIRASRELVARELAMKVESIDIELEGPPRICVIQHAMASRSDHSASQPHAATSIDAREQELLDVIAGLKEKQQRLEAKLHKAQSDVEELRRSIIESDR